MNIEFEKHRVEFEHTMLGFVEAELQMALTFCLVAKGASSSEKRSRNFKNAKIAYRSALDALKRLDNTDAETIVRAGTHGTPKRERLCLECP